MQELEALAGAASVEVQKVDRVLNRKFRRRAAAVLKAPAGALADATSSVDVLQGEEDGKSEVSYCRTARRVGGTCRSGDRRNEVRGCASR